MDHGTQAENDPLIPTRLRAKLPRRLSYPVGAKELSEGLRAAPHFESLEIVFRDRPTFWASEFQRWLEEALPYPVVVADFRPRSKPGFIGSNAMVDKGFYDEKWEIKVHPVLREKRHLAHRLVCDEGVSQLLAWLRQSQTAGWNLQSHFCELVFDPKQDTITACETTAA